MAANAWGLIPLQIQSLGKPDAETFVSEHRLIPDPATDHHAVPSTILMGAGRTRIRRDIRGWIDRADFDQMMRDRHSMTVRLLVLEDGTSMNARIRELRGDEAVGSDIVWLAVGFLEA